MNAEPKTSQDLTVKDRIVAAAIDVFSSQGRHGARLEHIAQQAGVNKALIYYHFRDRTGLYRAAFAKQFTLIMSEVGYEMQKLPADEHDAIAVLKHFVRSHYRAVIRHKHCVRLFIGGTADDPELTRSVVMEMTGGQQPPVVTRILSLIEHGVQAGQLRPVNPKQLFISMLSLNLFFFVARPVAETFLDLQIEDEELFMEERLTSILDLLLYGAVERRPQ